MQRSDQNICPECGARLEKGASTCDLCGADLDGVYTFMEKLDEEGGPEVNSPVTAPTEDSSPAGVFCNSCGWQNPPGARFCSICGSQLQDVSSREEMASPGVVGARSLKEKHISTDFSTEAIPATTNRLTSGWAVAIIITSGLLLVIALFLTTSVSKYAPLAANTTPAQVEPIQSPIPPDHESQPLPPQVEARVNQLEAEIAQATGDERLTHQNELINLYIGTGRLDRAAAVQDQVARVLNTPEAWSRSGNLYFDWMETVQGSQKSTIAGFAISAYQKVLDMQPDNLDVRADMAWAYQYDPQKAMEAINQTNIVLEKNPNHVQANFNKGIFLIQINRLDQALEQFERVKGIVEEGTPEYQRAESAIEAIRELGNSRSS